MLALRLLKLASAREACHDAWLIGFATSTGTVIGTLIERDTCVEHFGPLRYPARFDSDVFMLLVVLH